MTNNSALTIVSAFVRWHENSVDVVPHDGSKAVTIMNLANRVGIAPEDVISFGDGQNDREMLRMSGIGVAMGNAVPEVQAEAKMVTDTNDQDGIWKALKELAFDLGHKHHTTIILVKKRACKQDFSDGMPSLFCGFYDT